MDSAPDTFAPSRYDAPPATPRGGLSPVHLERALAAIQARLPGSTLVADLAAALPMSPFHFARAFKVSVGVPPHRYILQQRIERAKALLARPDLSIAQVSAQAGFKTTSHFTSVFRQIAGETPARYRASRRLPIAG